MFIVVSILILHLSTKALGKTLQMDNSVAYFSCCLSNKFIHYYPKKEFNSSENRNM